MPLQTTGTPSTGSDTFAKFPGAVVNRKTITRVELLSGQPYLESWNPDEFGVRLVFETPESWDNEDDLYLGGSMQWQDLPDGRRELYGFKGAFPIRDLFDDLGIPLSLTESIVSYQGNEMDVVSVPQAELDRAVGREVLVLQYDFRYDPDKKRMRRRTFRRPVVAGSHQAGETFDAAARRLYDLFVDQADGGWVKDWKRPNGSAPPEAGNAGGDGAATAHPAAAPARTADPFGQATGAASGSDYSFEPDDDLPF